MPYEFLSKVANHRLLITLLCKGVRADGSPYYAYIRLRPEAAWQLEDISGDAEIALEKYGEILQWGLGHEPPPDIRKRFEATEETEY